MKKSFKMTVILITTAVISGCSSSQSAKIPLMDFQAEMEWKAPDPAVGTRPRILFVGNSHTFYNNLTGIFVNIINASGHKSDVNELSTGYYSLKQFADPQEKGGAVLENALTQQKWDFVILQENTSKALSAASSEEMYPSARLLDEKIRAAGGQTVFLMTWAPKDGMKNGFKNEKREEIQSDLASSYMTIAEELDSLLIPAGISFMRCAQEYPDIELWDSDGQHPSPAGSYLAACTAYALIYQESPVDCSYIGTLDEEQARKLQLVAAQTVLKQ